jgi:hypothetical protein
MANAATVEELIAQVRTRAHHDGAFDLWIPDAVTFRGDPVPLPTAIAVLRDVLRSAGYTLDTYTTLADGRRYHCIAQPPT